MSRWRAGCATHAAGTAGSVAGQGYLYAQNVSFASMVSSVRYLLQRRRAGCTTAFDICYLEAFSTAAPSVLLWQSMHQSCHCNSFPAWLFTAGTRNWVQVVHRRQ